MNGDPCNGYYVILFVAGSDATKEFFETPAGLWFYIIILTYSIGFAIWFGFKGI